MEIKVSEIVKKDIIKVKRSMSLRKLLNLFKEFHTHPLIPVVNDQDELIGVVYPENMLDLLRPAQAKLFRNIPFMEIDEDVFDLDPVPAMGDLLIVDDIMDTNVISIKDQSLLNDAYAAMRRHKRDRLPVVDAQGKIVGIIGVFDIIWRMFKEKEIV
ncbi:MAG: CBS domain-containing protein [Candidatus Omnitrophica bacterium]|nr:CBS domain-containing protein [Candidatus Omnitrophota bacterium]